MHATTQGLWITLAAVLAWGAQLPIAAGAMQHIDSATINLIRYAVASVIFVLLLWQRAGWQPLCLGLRTPLVWWAGGLGMAGSGSLVYLGLQYTRPEIAVLLIALQPTMTAIAEWALYRKRPPRFTLLCMAAAFGGVAWAVTRGGELLLQPSRQASHELLGSLLVILGASSWVFYTLTSIKLRPWSALQITAVTCVTALPSLLVFWLLYHALGHTLMPQAQAWPETGLRLAFLALGGVVAAMFLWNAGAARIGTLNAMLVLNLMPVVTFGVRALEGVPLHPTEVWGACVVMLALMANNLWQRRHSNR
jgi:drug/metabolite transporter (DMT)-like permease